MQTAYYQKKTCQQKPLPSKFTAGTPWRSMVPATRGGAPVGTQETGLLQLGCAALQCWVGIVRLKTLPGFHLCDKQIMLRQ